MIRFLGNRYDTKFILGVLALARAAALFLFRFVRRIFTDYALRPAGRLFAWIVNRRCRNSTSLIE